MAQTLASHGADAIAYDLALDLVLNDIVEQARNATGADSAAIALARDGAMECRASIGDSAPGLGVRVETDSGLSGACLNTGQVQSCIDTQSDPRVDAESCRQLGIRSIVIVPLIDEERPFGILEVACSHPDAFGDVVIRTLEGLAGRIVTLKQEADEGVAEFRRGTAKTAETLRQPPQPEVPIAPRPLFSMADEPAKVDDSPKKDPWTTILATLVIATALVLGVLIGWRSAVGRYLGESRRSAQPASTAASSPMPQNPAAEVKPTQESPAPKFASPSAHEAAPATAPPSGGLIVTQNGKVIYRMSPPSNSNVARSAGDPELNGRKLIRRVEPEYPERAKAARIQGRVALDVQILADGSVGTIGISEGNPLLAEAAVRAVRQWKYQPYIVDGQPLQSQTRVNVTFSLPDNH